MIKKYVLGFLVCLGLCFSFSYGAYVSIGMSSQLADGNTCVVNSDLSIECTNSNHVLANKFTSNQYHSSLNGIFWSQDGIGVLHNSTISGYTMQGLLKDGFNICVGNTSLSNISGYSLWPDCNNLPGFSSQGNYSYQELVNKLTSETPLYWFHDTNLYAGVQLGIVYSGWYFSLMVDGYGSSQPYLNGNFTSFNFGFPSDIVNYDNISWNNQYVLKNPKRSSFPDMGYGGIEIGSDFSALNYYEKTYGWDESICYVGIDNLTTMYGQNGSAFQKGKGLSIFEAFSGLYGNTDLNKVYRWINSWLINYENWFGVSGSPGMSSDVGNPSFLANYNSGTNQVDIYYDNLSFPFLNNPVAVYFMANNIEDQSPYSTMGSAVVSYCNIKINSGTFNQIIDQSDKNNINNYTEQNNTNHGLNSDGTVIEHDGYFGSGVDIAFSGDTSIKNTLRNFFEEFDTALGTLDVNTNNRILPTWIVSAFIFVVLFKFLRKR